jgi:hypothetical protein
MAMEENTQPHPRMPGLLQSLSARLLVLTVFFIMLSEILIFAPSAGRFRVTYLEERIQAGHLAILALMAAEGLQPYPWSNGPHESYFAHSHGYHKVIYVVRGSITFGLPQSGQRLTLKTGDRLDLPAGIVHEARVGAYGATCLEGHRG